MTIGMGDFGGMTLKTRADPACAVGVRPTTKMSIRHYVM